MIIKTYREICSSLHFAHLFGAFLHCTIDIGEVLLRAFEDVLCVSQIHIVLRH